jgi:transposase
VTRQAYPADLTDFEWSLIQNIAPEKKPEEIPKREFMNAILYANQSDVPRRLLPHDLTALKKQRSTTSASDAMRGHSPGF